MNKITFKERHRMMKLHKMMMMFMVLIIITSWVVIVADGNSIEHDEVRY